MRSNGTQKDFATVPALMLEQPVSMMSMELGTYWQHRSSATRAGGSHASKQLANPAVGRRYLHLGLLLYAPFRTMGGSRCGGFDEHSKGASLC